MIAFLPSKPNETTCLERCSSRVFNRLKDKKVQFTAGVIFSTCILSFAPASCSMAGVLALGAYLIRKRERVNHKEELEKILGFSLGKCIVQKLIVNGVATYLRGEGHNEEDFEVIRPNLAAKANAQKCVVAFESFIQNTEKMAFSHGFNVKYVEGFFYGLEDEIIFLATSPINAVLHLFNVLCQDHKKEHVNQILNDTLSHTCSSLGYFFLLSSGNEFWLELISESNKNKEIYEDILRELIKIKNEGSGNPFCKLQEYFTSIKRWDFNLIMNFILMLNDLCNIVLKKGNELGKIPKAQLESISQLQISIQQMKTPLVLKDIQQLYEIFAKQIDHPLRNPYTVKNVRQITSLMQKQDIRKPLIVNIGFKHLAFVKKGLSL